jgi:hypothetical protein
MCDIDRVNIELHTLHAFAGDIEVVRRGSGERGYTGQGRRSCHSNGGWSNINDRHGTDVEAIGGIEEVT